MNTPPQPPNQPQPPKGYYQPPAGYRPPPPIDTSRIRPSLHWLWAALGIFVLGIAGAIVFVVVAVSEADDLSTEMTEFRTNRPVEVQLKQDEDQAIFSHTIDRDGSIDDTNFDDLVDERYSDVRCKVTDLTNDSPVKVEYPSSSFTTTSNSDRYDRIADFDVYDGGLYRIACRNEADPETSLPLAVGKQPNLFGFVGSILLVFLIPSVATFIAIAILILVLVLRQSSKKKLRREAGGGMYGGPPAPGQQPPQPPQQGPIVH